MVLSKEKYVQRRQLGLCVQCGNNSPDGKTRCPVCDQKANDSRKRRDERRRQQGICTVCGREPQPGRILCKVCSDIRTEIAKARYHKNKEAGVCRTCGGEPEDGHVLCATCFEKDKEYHAEFYQRRRESGLCLGCGGQPLENRRMCAACGKIANENSKQSWHKLRQIVLAAYGNKCACCGCTTLQQLQIDHIDGGGRKHMEEIGPGQFYRWLKKRGFPTGFQILCAACNWSKRVSDEAKRQQRIAEERMPYQDAQNEEQHEPEPVSQ